MKAKIELILKLPIEIAREEEMYLASCTVLDVFSQGETEERAKENIVEALYLFLRSCFERGNLDTVLKQCGFNAVGEGEAEEFKRLDKMVGYVEVPLHLLSHFEENPHCQAAV